MKRLHIFLFCFFLFGGIGNAFAVPSDLSAPEATVSQNEIQPCAKMVRECFPSQGIERSNCFFSASKHPFCDGTELGALIFKRFGYSQMRLGGDNAAPGFLGPIVVDQQCVSEFDILLEQRIKQANPEISKLEDQLKECQRDLSQDLSRP